MTLYNHEKNKIYFGSTNKLSDWEKDKLDQNKIIDKVKLMLKNYLELDNVSFLFGTGTSIHLGAVSVRNFPKEVEEYIEKQDSIIAGIQNEFLATVKCLQSDFLEYGKERIEKGEKDIFKDIRGWKYGIYEDGTVRDYESEEIAIEYERVLNYLIAKDFVLSEDKSKKRTDKISELIAVIKEGLFNVCDLEKRSVPKAIIDRKKASLSEKDKEQGDLLEKRSKYIYHEKFIKALLQRPLNLRRANIFTSNYDLAFEYAFDKLGVHYIDGFAGFHKLYA